MIAGAIQSSLSEGISRNLALVADAEAERRREIGRRIQRARAEYRVETGESLTQADLARHLGLSDARVVRFLESGQSAQDKYLGKIAEVTGKPIEWFYGDETTTTSRDLEAEVDRLNRQLEQVLLEFQELRQIIRGHGEGENGNGGGDES